MTRNGTSHKIRIGAIILLSFLLTLACLYFGTETLEKIRNETMIANARASARASDGAPNLVVLNGEGGCIGGTASGIKYLKDGYIEVVASNPGDSPLWKQISTLVLEPGTYTLSGFSGLEPETVELLLSIEMDGGTRQYCSQYDGDSLFEISGTRNAQLYLQIYPAAEVTTTARPAIYREAEGNG